MNTSGGTSIGWMQFYEQTSADEVSAPSPGFSDATAVTASIVSSSKPIRLRPRVSKRKPTTLLNADASNFRALVQQFTGCPATHVSANRRCPINLNFALGKEHNQQQQTFGNVGQDALFSYSSSGANAERILDEFELDDISLQAFNRDAPYSNEYANDGNYFL
ncbi:hypothetical protein F3Y22_tig00020895pilonHSYRG00006 [Hibiscus syriacus]|uniref:VQ domain-containing protein n=1 Tax=Hibiscus syriacus TaxID=106335 RepID=A0A6A3BWF0_HIBSY|nr:hypothetical protein F3Y22_tig00020895pilonHSYRG00006 [Hibiscus syriacus]